MTCFARSFKDQITRMRLLNHTELMSHREKFRSLTNPKSDIAETERRMILVGEEIEMVLDRVMNG